jgi:hypothetical protein
MPGRARSGGHSYAGYCTLTDGVVLDLRRLDWVRFDKARYLVNQTDSGSELILPVLRDGHVVGTVDIESNEVGASAMRSTPR